MIKLIVLTVTCAQQAATKTIPLSGQGRVPEVPLCAMCKVDGCFVLIPINEITQMRPDMTNFVQSAYAKDDPLHDEEDPDYKPSAASKPAASVKASTSKAKATPKTVKVALHALLLWIVGHVGLQLRHGSQSLAPENFRLFGTFCCGGVSKSCDSVR
jgi:hypothetical protein